MTEKHVRLHARVYGRVQGVNFRYYTRAEASARGLTGWVANRFDGSVEVVAEGEERSVRRFLQFLHTGPPAARVDRIETEWLAASGEFGYFRVTY